MKSSTFLLVVGLVFLADCCPTTAAGVASCPQSVIPEAEPFRRRNCNETVTRLSFISPSSSAGPLRVTKLRADRSALKQKTVSPGSRKGFSGICPGTQFLLEAGNCDKCIDVFLVPFGTKTSRYTVTVPSCSSAPNGSKKPNIVLVMADDIGPELFGFNGGPVDTPVIDRLSKTSLSFVRAWATPLCRTTRSIIMTGKLPFATKWFSHKSPPPPEFRPFGPSIGNLGQQAGYKTLLTGKWQIFGKARGPDGYGFDEYSLWRHSDVQTIGQMYETFTGPVYINQTSGKPGKDQNRYSHPLVAKNDVVLETGPLNFSSNIFLNHLQEFMRENKRKGEKSFVYWPSTLAHKDYNFETKKQAYLPMPILENGQVVGYDSAKPSFEKTIGYLDTMMGLLLDGLKRDGLYEDTIVIFCTDNGSVDFPGIEGFKGSTRDERGVLVPVLFHHGGGLIPARTTNELFSLTDIYATLAGFMSMKVSPPRRNSYDFSDFIIGKQDNGPRKWLFSFLDGDRMIRTASWFLDSLGRLSECSVNGPCQRIPNNVAPGADGRAEEARMKEILRELESTGYSDASVLF